MEKKIEHRTKKSVLVSIKIELSQRGAFLFIFMQAHTFFLIHAALRKNHHMFPHFLPQTHQQKTCDETDRAG
jgi:hypothetical protein